MDDNTTAVYVTHSGLTPAQTIALLDAVDQHGLCSICRANPADAGNGRCGDCHQKMTAVLNTYNR